MPRDRSDKAVDETAGVDGDRPDSFTTQNSFFASLRQKCYSVNNTGTDLGMMKEEELDKNGNKVGHKQEEDDMVDKGAVSTRISDLLEAL